MPERWISVPSATRDSENYLWYSVNIDGHKGWLPKNGILLKMGTPTMRESPYNDIDTSILSYELSDRTMTLSITMTRDEGDNEGHATSIELYRGRTGEMEN